MKNIFGVIAICLFMFLMACGGSEESDNPGGETQEIVLKGYESLDLSQWGFDMSIMVPNAEDNGEAQVELTERGALEIVVGQTFGVEIMYGEGDVELLKMDLNEDLVFASEIVSEDETTLIYKQSIPDSGVKTQNHFFHKVQIGADVYEVRDLLDGDFGLKMIEKMADAAKTIRSNNTEASV